MVDFLVEILRYLVQSNIANAAFIIGALIIIITIIGDIPRIIHLTTKKRIGLAGFGTFLIILGIVSYAFGSSVPTTRVTPTPTPTLTATPLPPPATMTPTPAPTLTASATSTTTSTVFPTPTCPYAGKTDDDTIHGLINAEATAVNNQSLDIIVSIFAPDTLFEDYTQNDLKSGKPPRTWLGPIARYRDDLFKNTDLKDVENVNITQVGESIDGKIVWYVSGSQGFYKSKGTGTWNQFINGSLTGPNKTQYGSDHWTLQRGPEGCWIIVRFTFDAGHIPFPP